MIAEKIPPTDAVKAMIAAGRADRRRVTEIIARDQIDRQRDRERDDARAQFESGSLASLPETVLEPTPEWLAKGENRTFIPKQPDGTVRVAKSVRRVLVPIADRMWLAGKLTDQHRDACRWYRNRFDEAGLDGRWSTTGFSLTSGCSGPGGQSYAPMALHHREVVARSEYRAARAAIDAAFVAMFEAVVIGDIPISRAWRFSRTVRARAEAKFRDCAQQVSECMEKNRFDAGPDRDAD